MDNSKLKVRASVDLPSPKEVDRQIHALEKNISKLKVSGKLENAALKKLTNQLDTLKATVTTVNFSPTALKELTGQVEKALKDIKISNVRIGNLSSNTGKMTQDTGRNISDTFTKNVNNIIDSNSKNGGGLVSWFRLPTNSPFLATVEFSSDAYEF